MGTADTFVILPFCRSARYDPRVLRRVISPSTAGLALWIAGLSACSTPGGAPAPLPIDQPAASSPRSIDGYEAHFLLRWNGARIGDASEWVRRHAGGLRFQREERVTVRRGDQIVPMLTRIAIDLDAELRAQELLITQISGPSESRGRATRHASTGDWLVQYDGEDARTLPGDAVPAELIPLQLFARQQEYNRGEAVFAGPVLLAGYGFALGHMSIVAEDAHEFSISLAGRASTDPRDPEVVLRGHWRTTRYGSLMAAYSGQGVSAIRAQPSELMRPFSAPEIVDSASIPLMGATSTERAPSRLVLDPVEREPPPALPGQRVEVRGRVWHVHLATGDSFAPPLAAISPESDMSAEPRRRALDQQPHHWSRLADDIIRRARARRAREQIAALARATDTLLADDLGAPAARARAALTLGRGDCTAHAVVFYALADARGIPVRLVTGYRLDRDRLVRHRWALAAADGVWIAVDPTYGEAPASPGLIGLAVHRASSAEISLIDETVFTGLANARARVQE